MPKHLIAIPSGSTLPSDVSDLPEGYPFAVEAGSVATLYILKSGVFEEVSAVATAGTTSYDNTTSGLSAEDVQAAIDELVVDLAADDPWQGVYDSGTTYRAGALVEGSDDQLYASKVGSNIGNDPVTDGGVHWTQYPTFASEYKGAYSSGTTYAAGDLTKGSDVQLYASLAGGNIGNDPVTDGGVHWTQYPAPVVIETVNVVGAAGATQTIVPVTTATMGTYLLNANCVFTPPTPVRGASFTIETVQDGTGGWTATFTGVRWPLGVVPTASIAAGAVDDWAFVCLDGSNWNGVQVKGLA